MPTRRQFIKTGLIGGAALVVVRAAYGPFSNPARPIADDYRFAYLNEAQRTVMAAVAPVLLAGALPQEPQAYAKALQDVVRGLDTAISGFTPQVQGELRQLFDLLTFPPMGGGQRRGHRRFSQSLGREPARSFAKRSTGVAPTGLRRMVRQPRCVAAHWLWRSAPSGQSMIKQRP